MDPLQFKRLSDSDKQVIDSHNATLPPYADWAYGTLRAWWDFYDDLEYLFHNDNLIIKSSYLSAGKSPYITIIGNNDVVATADDIFEWQKNNGYEQLIASVPEYTASALIDTERYNVKDDPDNAEYVLSSSAHASLDDPAHKRIRQKIHAFKRQPFYEALSVEDIPLTTLRNKLRIINALHSWDTKPENDRERSEGIVIDKSLRISEIIDLRCFALLFNGEIAAFVLYKQISKDTINVNHLKVNYQYKDIFHYTLYALAEHMTKQDIDYINIEQDLGLPGLRTYKQRLRPTHILQKYSVRPNAIN